MSRSRIHIENMTIRLPRSMKNDPRRVAGDVGREVLTQLAETLDGRTGTHRVDSVSATLSSDQLNASGIRTIVTSVAKKASGRNKR